MADKKGFVVGFNESTSTSVLAGQAMRGSPARRRKKRAGSKAPVRKRRATKARRTSGRKKKPARLVKGSAAAKRYMAKIRRMRK